jgi:hypothetical protein
MILWHRLAARGMAMLVSAATAIAMAFGANAETPSPQAFVDGIYKHYLGKESKGLPLSSAAVIRRYFAPPLCDVMVKDFTTAWKRGEVPQLNGDPFVDAQDWEVSDLKSTVTSTGAKTAVATVNFIMFDKPRSLTLDLVNTSAGWRIADIKWAQGSLRGVYKLK